MSKVCMLREQWSRFVAEKFNFNPIRTGICQYWFEIWFFWWNYNSLSISITSLTIGFNVVQQERINYGHIFIFAGWWWKCCLLAKIIFFRHLSILILFHLSKILSCCIEFKLKFCNFHSRESKWYWYLKWFS